MTRPGIFPTRSIVPGEEELGEQKRCPRCRDWWPIEGTTEFFGRRPNGEPGSWCRACSNEARYLRHPARHVMSSRSAGVDDAGMWTAPVPAARTGSASSARSARPLR
jgi:hypothetical protein